MLPNAQSPRRRRLHGVRLSAILEDVAVKSILCSVALLILLVVSGTIPSIADTYSKEFPGKGTKEAFEKSKVNLRNGLVLAKNGKLAEAEAEYRESIEIYPHFAVTHFDLGKVLYEQKKVDEAVKEFQTAIKLEPKLYDAWYSLAVVYEDLEQFDLAEVIYRKAVQIKPDYFDAIFNLALLLKSEGKLDEAECNFKLAAALDVSQKDKDDVAAQLKALAAQKKREHGAEP